MPRHLLYGGGEGECVIHGSQVYAPRNPTVTDMEHRNDKYLLKEFDFDTAPVEYEEEEEDE